MQLFFSNSDQFRENVKFTGKSKKFSLKNKNYFAPKTENREIHLKLKHSQISIATPMNNLLEKITLPEEKLLNPINHNSNDPINFDSNGLLSQLQYFQEENITLKKQLRQTEAESKKQIALLEQTLELKEQEFNEMKISLERMKKMNDNIMSTICDLGKGSSHLIINKAIKELEISTNQHTKEMNEFKARTNEIIKSLESENKKLKERLTKAELKCKELMILNGKDQINFFHKVNELDGQNLITELINKFKQDETLKSKENGNTLSEYTQVNNENKTIKAEEYDEEKILIEEKLKDMKEKHINNEKIMSELDLDKTQELNFKDTLINQDLLKNLLMENDHIIEIAKDNFELFEIKKKYQTEIEIIEKEKNEALDKVNKLDAYLNKVIVALKVLQGYKNETVNKPLNERMDQIRNLVNQNEQAINKINIGQMLMDPSQFIKKLQLQESEGLVKFSESKDSHNKDFSNSNNNTKINQNQYAKDIKPHYNESLLQPKKESDLRRFKIDIQSSGVKSKKYQQNLLIKPMLTDENANQIIPTQYITPKVIHNKFHLYAASNSEIQNKQDNNNTSKNSTFYKASFIKNTKDDRFTNLKDDCKNLNEQCSSNILKEINENKKQYQIRLNTTSCIHDEPNLKSSIIPNSDQKMIMNKEINDVYSAHSHHHSNKPSISSMPMRDSNKLNIKISDFENNHQANNPSNDQFGLYDYSSHSNRNSTFIQDQRDDDDTPEECETLETSKVNIQSNELLYSPFESPVSKKLIVSPVEKKTCSKEKSAKQEQNPGSTWHKLNHYRQNSIVDNGIVDSAQKNLNKTFQNIEKKPTNGKILEDSSMNRGLFDNAIHSQKYPKITGKADDDFSDTNPMLIEDLNIHSKKNFSRTESIIDTNSGMVSNSSNRDENYQNRRFSFFNPEIYKEFEKKINIHERNKGNKQKFSTKTNVLDHEYDLPPGILHEPNPIIELGTAKFINQKFLSPHESRSSSQTTTPIKGGGSSGGGCVSGALDDNLNPNQDKLKEMENKIKELELKDEGAKVERQKVLHEIEKLKFELEAARLENNYQDKAVQNNNKSPNLSMNISNSHCLESSQDIPSLSLGQNSNTGNQSIPTSTKTSNNDNNIQYNDKENEYKIEIKFLINNLLKARNKLEKHIDELSISRNTLYTNVNNPIINSSMCQNVNNKPLCDIVSVNNLVNLNQNLTGISSKTIGNLNNAIPINHLPYSANSNGLHNSDTKTNKNNGLGNNNLANQDDFDKNCSYQKKKTKTSLNKAIENFSRNISRSKSNIRSKTDNNTKGTNSIISGYNSQSGIIDLNQSGPLNNIGIRSPRTRSPSSHHQIMNQTTMINTILIRDMLKNSIGNHSNDKQAIGTNSLNSTTKKLLK